MILFIVFSMTVRRVCKEAWRNLPRRTQRLLLWTGIICFSGASQHPSQKTWRTFNFLMDDRQILSPTLKVLSIFNITRHVPYNSVKMKNCCFYCNLIYSVSLHIQTCYIYELRCNTWGVAHVIFIYNFRTAFVNQASEKIKHHYFFSGLPKKIHS